MKIQRKERGQPTEIILYLADLTFFSYAVFSLPPSLRPPILCTLGPLGHQETNGA